MKVNCTGLIYKLKKQENVKENGIITLKYEFNPQKELSCTGCNICNPIREMARLKNSISYPFKFNEEDYYRLTFETIDKENLHFHKQGKADILQIQLTKYFETIKKPIENVEVGKGVYPNLLYIDAFEICENLNIENIIAFVERREKLKGYVLNRNIPLYNDPSILLLYFITYNYPKETVKKITIGKSRIEQIFSDLNMLHILKRIIDEKLRERIDMEKGEN